MTRRITPQTTLDNLKNEAKRRLKELRAQGADVSGLREVQHALALEYGFTGWTELKQALAVPPEVAKYEQLAEDMVNVYATGDEAALARIVAHYGRSSTAEDLRAMVWRLVYKVRQAGGAAHAFGVAEAQGLIAGGAGFSNWAALTESVAKGVLYGVPAYRIDAKRNSIGPGRVVSDQEWDAIRGVMKERKLTVLETNGMMTDAGMKGIAELEHVTTLRLGGSRGLTDDGLLHLAKMPQLEHLDLNEYPGGKLTDRGLEVLRHLPNLRTFTMCWQRGISDAGAANLKFCDKLESVILMGSPTGDGAIEALRGKPALRRLDSGKLVTDVGLAMLREFPKFRTWQGDPSVDAPMDEDNEPTHLLIDGPFTNAGLANLAGLDALYALDLFWHVTGITSAGFGVLARLPHLAVLGCDGKLSDDEAMGHIGRMPGLRKLRAQESVATDDGFVALSKSVSLEKFWGRECPGLTGRGFAAFSRMPALRTLGVGCKNVDDESLSSLPRFPALRELTPIGVTDAGFRHVGQCGRLEKLSCMYCRDTTDVATGHIADLQLKSYYAGLTQITDLSLEILGRMESLESIEFYETKNVTDAGLGYLAGLPRLREIHIGGLPNVSLAGTAVFPARVRVEYNL